MSKGYLSSTIFPRFIMFEEARDAEARYESGLVTMDIPLKYTKEEAVCVTDNTCTRFPSD